MTAALPRRCVCGQFAAHHRSDCHTCASRVKRQRREAGLTVPRTPAKPRCVCGVLVAEHTQCSACGLLAGVGAPHLITAADLEAHGAERDLCPWCRRARSLRGAA